MIGLGLAGNYVSRRGCRRVSHRQCRHDITEHADRPAGEQCIARSDKAVIRDPTRFEFVLRYRDLDSVWYQLSLRTLHITIGALHEGGGRIAPVILR